MKKCLVLVFICIFSALSFSGIIKTGEWNLLESLTVGADGESITSSIILESGKFYVAQAEGTYIYNEDVVPNGIADAEWLNDYQEPPAPWIERTNPDVSDTELDSYVNDNPVDWFGSTDGVHFYPHTFSPDHVYTYLLEGTGDPVNFYIRDTYYDDNVGELTVILFEIPEPCTLVLLGLSGLLLRRRE